MAAKKSNSSGERKSKGKPSEDRKFVARNRKARYDYEILDTLEAGMALMGTEVKSLRAGRVNLTDSWAEVRSGELFLRNLHISPYEQASRFNHEPTRSRKLLVHKKEIRRLVGKLQEKGLTLVPLAIYFQRGWAKCELGLARGKRFYDKRASKAERDAERKIQQAVRGGMRRRGAED